MTPLEQELEIAQIADSIERRSKHLTKISVAAEEMSEISRALKETADALHHIVAYLSARKS